MAAAPSHLGKRSLDGYLLLRTDVPPRSQAPRSQAPRAQAPRAHLRADVTAADAPARGMASMDGARSQRTMLDGQVAADLTYLLTYLRTYLLTDHA